MASTAMLAVMGRMQTQLRSITRRTRKSNTSTWSTSASTASPRGTFPRTQTITVRQYVRARACLCVRACVRVCVHVCACVLELPPPLPSATASPLLCLLLLWCFAGKLPALYVCEYCFKYMAHRDAFLSHECKRRTPPGKEVFRSVPAACCVGAVCICACMRACVCMHVCAGDLRGGC